MGSFPKSLATFLSMLFAAALTGQAAAQAVVSTTLVSGDPALQGSRIKVGVNVDTTTAGGLKAAAAALRLSYNANSLTFVGVEDGNLGPASASNEEGTAPNVFRDVATLGDETNTSDTVTAFVLEFQVKTNPDLNYDIIVSDDPDAAVPLLATDLATTIGRTFDSSATTGLAPALTLATVATTSVVGDPSALGSIIEIPVAVASNTTPFIPVGASFRVTYNPASVTFVDAANGDLGPVLVGNAEPAAGGLVTRDFSTLGDGTNTDATPTAFTMRFQVNADAAFPYSILVDSDPDAAVVMLADDFVTSIPVGYDNTQTTNLGAGVPLETIVTSTVTTAGPILDGSNFSVQVAVSANNRQLIPAAAAFRVAYPSDKVTFLSVTDGLLGPADASNEEGTAPNVTRDVATLGDTSNTDRTPVVYTLNFAVNAGASGTVSVTVADDPDAGAKLLATDALTDIPHTFDNQASFTITPATTVVQSTVTTVGDINPGDNFDVLVAVSENNRPLVPSAAALRVSYPSDKVSFVSIVDGQLGPADAGNEEGTAPNVFRDAATLGNVANADATPSIYTLTFQVLPAASGSVAITVADDPDAGATLLATDAVTNIPHTFDNQASFTIVVPTPTPTATVVPTTTPAPTPTATVAPTTTPAPTPTATVVPTTTPAPTPTATVVPTTTPVVTPTATVVPTTTPTPTPSATPSPTATPTPTPTPAAVIRPFVSAGDTTVFGTQFSVQVPVAENPTGQVPIAASFQVLFSSASVTFNGADQGDLGSVFTGAVQNTGDPVLDRRVRFATTSNFANADDTPIAATLRFTTLANPAVPFAIVIEDDPTASANLIDNTTAAIAHVFDNSEIATLGVVPTPSPSPTPSPTPIPTTVAPTTTPTIVPTTVAPTTTPTIVPTTVPPTATPTPTPTPAAIIRPVVSAGDTTVFDTEFSIQVPVTENNTGQIPIAASLQVLFPSNAVTFVAADAGDLGSIFTSAVQNTGDPVLDRRVRFSTTSNFANVDGTPLIATLRFRTLVSPNVPFAIVVEDDPNASSNLIDNTTAAIAHVFDNSEIDTLGVVPTPSPSPTPIPTTVAPTTTPTIVPTTVPPTTTPTIVPTTVAPTTTPTIVPTTVAPTITPTPTPFAIVRGFLDPADQSIVTSATLTIPVQVAENNTGLTPIAANFRVYFDADKVSIASVSEGELGSIIAGPVETNTTEPTLPGSFQDIVTFSNLSNSNDTPVAFTLNALVIGAAGETFSIIVADDPGSSGPLLGPTSDVRIPHVFDNAGTTDLVIAAIVTPTPTAVPTTATPTTTPTATATPSPSPSPSISPSPSPSISPSPSPSVSPTISPTITPGTPTPTPLPNVVSFSFSLEDQENPDRAWTFAVPPAYAGGTTGTFDEAGERLVISTTRNNNAFGWWESPTFTVADTVNAPLVAGVVIRGDVGADSLFRASWTVSSDAAVAAANLPTLRLRASAFNHAVTSEVMLTSQSTGAVSPAPAGTVYDQFFSLPALDNQFRLNFDVLSFDPADAAVASLALEAVTVSYLGVDSLPTPTAGPSLSFLEATTNGFTPRNGGSVLVAPALFESAIEGLAIKGANELPSASQIIFGYWGLETNIPLTGGKLYRVLWTVGSDAPASEKLSVPAFRLRVNDSSLALSALLQVNSFDNTTRVPVVGSSEQYALWFVAPDAIDGNNWIFSFDYLAIAGDTVGGGNDDPRFTLFLEALQVESYDLP